MGTQPLHLLPNVALLGIADDQGVLHVGGRLGAARGPEAFRQHWKRLQRPWTFVDCGDLRLPIARGRSGIESSCDRMEEAQKQAQRLLVIGGGNDHAWSQVAALRRAQPEARIGCVNLDAHLDLRPLTAQGQVTSGSPFRLLIDDAVVRGEDLVEFGTQRQSNAPVLFEYAQTQGIEIVDWDALRRNSFRESIASVFSRALEKLARRVDWVVVCLDLDFLSQSDAPGVSAPSAEGLDAREAVEIVRICAAHSQVRSLGIYELNPDYDESGKTARLAATLAWHYADGVELAKSPRPKNQRAKKLAKKSKASRKSES